MINMASPLIGFSYYIWAVPLVNLLAALLIFFLLKRYFTVSLIISAAAALFSLLAGVMLSAERFVIDMPAMDSSWASILQLERLGDTLPIGMLSDGISSLFLMLVSLIIFILKLYAPAYFKYAHLRLNCSAARSNRDSGTEVKTSKDDDYVWQIPANKFSAHLTFWHFLASFLIISNDLWQSFIIIQLLGLNTYNLLECQIQKRVTGHKQKSSKISEEEKSDALFRRPNSFAEGSGSSGLIFHLTGFVLMLLGTGCLHINLGSVTFFHIAAVDIGKAALLSALGFLLVASGIGVQLYSALIKKAHKTEIFIHIPSAPYIPHLPAVITAVILHSCAALYLIFRLFPLICGQSCLMPSACFITAAGTAAAVLFALAALNSQKSDEILILLTLSQWGIVLLTLGMGSLSTAYFHTVSVSLTALLLFLASGSVLIRSGSRDLGAMGSLRSSMFYTWLACVFGGLSWLGIPPLLGFFSIYGILGFTFSFSVLTLLAFAVICLTQAAHLFVLVKAYRLTFESDASPKENESEPPSREIGPGLWVLPLALNTLILALGLTNIPYAWQLPLPSLYEDFMVVPELRAVGSPWLPITVYLFCCGAALYLSFYFHAKERKLKRSDDPKPLPEKYRSLLPLIDN